MISPKGAWLLGSLLASGCASTSLAPSIIRYEPLNPEEPEVRLGVRTGPRLASSLAALQARTLDAEVGTPVPPELGVSLEYQRTQPLKGGLALHLGAQAELFYFLPAPAIGVMAGLSYRYQIGTVSIAPSIAARGSTDFGVSFVTVKGSAVGGDLAVTLSATEGGTARLGITPFFSAWAAFNGENPVPALFAGAMLLARFHSVELLMGFGRVFSAGTAWNVPLLGVRAGGN